jgi:phage gp36-like protein
VPDSTYSTVDDLLLGDMPVAVGFSKQKFVNDAADELDSVVGRRYKTPLNVADDSPLPRHARLFVKRIANHIASGRLILALAAGGEDQALHAYGWSLVKGALDALEQIACGDYEIPGAEPLPGTSEEAKNAGPTVKNVDATSGVEAFYGDPRGQSYPPGALGVDPYPIIQGPVWVPGGGS